MGERSQDLMQLPARVRAVGGRVERRMEVDMNFGSTQSRRAGIPCWLKTAAVVVGAFLVMVFLSGTAAWADEEEEKKPLKLGVAKKSTKSSGLAGYAASIKLKKSDGEGTKISNSSLSKSSGKGTFSEGGGVSTGVAPQGAESQGSGVVGKPTKNEQWNKDYDTQKKLIEKMEKDLTDYDDRRGNNNDPHTGGNPANRAPGVVSSSQATRDAEAEKLEAERQRLEEMRAKARRDGVDLE